VSTETDEIQCANAECRVSQTGKCVEGLALDKCPHLARAAAGAQVVVADDKTETVDPTPEIPLAKSERLMLEDASAVMRAAPTRVIGIIGPTSSGKTSLIASLCDLFQIGHVDDLKFARSRTLFAFEQGCHHARATSRRNIPQTEHTSLASGLGFYHLGVCRGEAANIIAPWRMIRASRRSL
jgi:GTPase SAR1 family protein